MTLPGRFFALTTQHPIDPLDHPVLRTMSLRELADLPKPRHGTHQGRDLPPSQPDGDNR